MAKKRISKEDIAPEGLFDNIKTGAVEAKTQIDILKKAVNALKTSATTVKNSIPKGSPTSTKGMKDFDDLSRKANATMQAKLNIDKKILLETERLKVQRTKQNKLIKETVALEKAEIGSLKQLRLLSKKLRDEKEGLNLTTKKGATRLKEINAQLDKNNNILKKNATQLGKQKQNIGNYGSAVGKLRGGLARLGLAFGVFSVLRGVFTTVRDFEQAQADLASVLGVNTDEMSVLTEQAKELGSTTTFTASQVSELQKELAKLGFTQTQIQGMTKATLELAEATGTELGEAATVVGSTLRAFGLTANDTQRVVDVMAKSFSASSLDMSKFSSAMSTVAPIANAMGFSIERTTALIATLTDNGIDASTAGTGLRNMFLKAKEAGLTLDQALAEVANSSDKVGKSFELFGTRGATLGVVLADNAEATAKLNTQLLFADGSAEKMADTQRDTLGGSIKLLQSAWEGLVLKLEEGTGVFGGLKTVIAFVADNLETIIKVLAVLGTAFGVYKLINLTTKAMKGLSLAMSANPFGLIVAAAAAAAVAIASFSTQMSIAEKAADTLKNVELEAAKATANQERELKKLVETAQDAEKTDKQREEAIKAINAISPEMLGNITKENILTKEGADLIGNYVKAMRKKAMAEAINSKLIELSNDLLDAQMSKMQDNVSFWEQQWAIIKSGGVLNMDGFESKLNATAEANRKTKIKGIQAEIDALINRQEAIDAQPDIPNDPNDADPDAGGSGGGRAKKLQDLRRKIEDEQIKQIKDAETREIAAAVTANGRKVKDLKDLHATLEQKAELSKELGETLQMDLDKIDAKFKKIKKDREEKAAADEVKRKEQEAKDIQEAKKAEIAQLEAMFNHSLKVKEKELLASSKTQEEISAELLQFEIDQLVDRIKQYKEMFPEMEDEILGFEIDLLRKRRRLAEEELKATKDSEADMAELREEAIQATTDFLVDQIDQRIAKIDEETDAARKQADIFRQMAANGNIEAKDSLAEQNKLLQEAAAEKERLEKRKQRVLLVSSILQSYNSNLEAGDDSTTAFTKALTSKAALDQFIAGVGSFFDGTEDTGMVANGLDSNGGRFAVLHNNERVMTAKDNVRIGNVSNEEVARVMENHRMGKLGGSHTGSGWDNQLIVDELMSVSSKLEMVNNTIANKETNKIELGEITQSTLKIMETRQKGLKRTISTYKVKS